MNGIATLGLLALACVTAGCGALREGKASISYALEARQDSDDVVFTCKASSSGNCTYWVGIPGSSEPSGYTTLQIGKQGITRMAHDAIYCVGVDLESPPAWPSCSTSSPGGTLYRTTTVDYRWW